MGGQAGVCGRSTPGRWAFRLASTHFLVAYIYNLRSLVVLLPHTLKYGPCGCARGGQIVLAALKKGTRML